MALGHPASRHPAACTVLALAAVGELELHRQAGSEEMRYRPGPVGELVAVKFKRFTKGPRPWLKRASGAEVSEEETGLGFAPGMWQGRGADNSGKLGALFSQEAVEIILEDCLRCLEEH